MNVGRITHRIWKETKLQPSRVRSSNLISCCLVCLHFLCDILPTFTVYYILNVAVPLNTAPRREAEDGWLVDDAPRGARFISAMMEGISISGLSQAPLLASSHFGPVPVCIVSLLALWLCLRSDILRRAKYKTLTLTKTVMIKIGTNNTSTPFADSLLYVYVQHRGACTYDVVTEGVPKKQAKGAKSANVCLMTKGRG